MTSPRSPADLVCVDDRLFIEHQVEPWTEIPLWLPPGPEFAAAWLFAPGGEREAFEDCGRFGEWTPCLSTGKEQAILAAHAAAQSRRPSAHSPADHPSGG